VKVEILGCSGGMGLGQYTTCYRINEHTLMDAGSGLGNLPQDELKKIRHILITHSHLDHICFLPLLIANLFEFLKQPIHVHALPEVLDTLKQHIFNWKVWPDFATLPNQEHPVVRFHTVQPWQPVVIDDLTFTAFPVDHIVPTCGYHVTSETGHTLAFTGDTTYGDAVMQALNKLGLLDVLMTECAFPDRLLQLAHVSKHLTPKLVKDFIDAMAHRPKQVWLSHLKPSQTHEIRAELEKLSLDTELVLLQTGQVFQL
jgi:ribonuclease BN (tRNA processing enzyme)